MPDSYILIRVEAFLKRTHTSPTTLGACIARNPHMVETLRAGAALQWRTRKKILDFLDAHKGRTEPVYARDYPQATKGNQINGSHNGQAKGR